MRYWISIIVLLRLCSASGIAGFVYDIFNGEPLPFTNIYVKGKPYGTSANDRGYYALQLPPNRYEVVISYVGYQDTTVVVDIPEGEYKRLDIYLTPQAEVGKEVVVEARREGGAFDMTTGHIITSGREALYSPSIFESDLFRTLQLLPGVVPKSDYSSALYIWGGLPAENLVTIDGVEVYNPSHIGGFVSVFNVDAIKEANLIKGGFPAQWGWRTGSVLEVISKEGNRKKFSGTVEASFLSQHLVLEGPLPKFTGQGSWMIALRRTYYDWLISLLTSDFSFPYYFYDGQAKITRDLNGGDKLTFATYFGKDLFKFDEDENSSDQFGMDWGNFTSSLTWMHIFRTQTFGNFILTFSRFGDNLYLGEMGLKDGIIDIAIKGNITHLLKKEHTIQYGGEMKFISLWNKYSEYEEEWHENKDAILLCAFAQDEWKPNPIWTLSGGTRGEFSSSGNYVRFSPRVSAQRLLDDKMRLKFSGGLYYQYFQSVPKSEELGLSIFDTWILCDEDIPPVWALHSVGRFETEHIWDLPISIDFYYKYIGATLRHDLGGAQVNELSDFIARGTGWSSGTDLMVRIPPTGRWTGWLGYSLGFVVHKFPGQNGDKPYFPEHDRRHKINIVLGTDLGYNWNSTLVWTYFTGAPYSYPVGKTYTAFLPYGTNTEPNPEPNVNPMWYMGGYGNRRVPPYHRLDLALTNKMQTSWGYVEFYLQVINLYWRRNIYTFLFPDWLDIHESTTAHTDTIPMIPIPLPSIGLRIRF